MRGDHHVAWGPDYLAVAGAAGAASPASDAIFGGADLPKKGGARLRQQYGTLPSFCLMSRRPYGGVSFD